MSGETISVVVPVYKEETNIDPFLERMERVLDGVGLPYEIIFCLDPSPDGTYEAISRNIERNGAIRLIQFSRRFGQPAATMAGILNCVGGACVVIDVDLQDPPELIAEMTAKWKEGYNVVYAKRRSRKGETVAKKVVAYLGYKLINSLTDVKIPTNAGDFRLIDRVVIEELRKLNETHGFLRGLVAFVGYKQTFVEYERQERHSGRGNYNRFLGSLRIGLNGLICFSAKPLQIMATVGFFVAAAGFLMALYYLLQKLVLSPDITPGLSSTIIFITIFSGVQLFSIGLLGEYVSRIYDEVKNRPMYIISEIVEKKR
ncbi:MAG: glycosyltransferase family 2 protein, partial [Synergistaceae bacterium]|nr:glycosyltransferase family 2 protein [Synergistaceae bacterium]